MFTSRLFSRKSNRGIFNHFFFAYVLCEFMLCFSLLQLFVEVECEPWRKKFRMYLVGILMKHEQIAKRQKKQHFCGKHTQCFVTLVDRAKKQFDAGDFGFIFQLRDFIGNIILQARWRENNLSVIFFMLFPLVLANSFGHKLFGPTTNFKSSIKV